jgi:hypothetical protein
LEYTHFLQIDQSKLSGRKPESYSLRMLTSWLDWRRRILQEGLDGGLSQLKQVARENASPTPFFSFGSLPFV